MLPPPRSTTPRRDCPLCGQHRSTVAYARAAQVRVFTPAYHVFERGLLIAAYQQEQIDRFRRLLDYDRVLDWARTTRRAVVGITHQKSRHPLRCYLNDVDPSTTDRPRWDVRPLLHGQPMVRIWPAFLHRLEDHAPPSPDRVRQGTDTGRQNPLIRPTVHGASRSLPRAGRA